MINVLLKDLILALESGSRPKGGASSSGVPSLGGENIGDDNKLNFKKQKLISVEHFKKMNQGLIEKEDILIVKDGATTGRVGFIDDEFPYDNAAINEHLFRLKVNKKKILPKYLYFYLVSPRGKSQVMKDFRGATIGGITKSFTQFVSVPLPSIKIQEKIINVLEEVTLIIERRQSQIAALDELTHNLFLEMLGDPISNNKEWDIKNFDEFAVIDTKMTNDFELHAEEYHMGIDNIQKSTGRIINLKRVSESNLTSGKYIFNSKHVIYSKIRPYLNKVALPNFSGICSADAYPLLPKENKSTRYFLAYLLRSDAFLNHVSQNSDRTNIPKVNKKQLQSFQGILPPVELQIQFEDNAKIIEKSRAMLVGALEEMDNLYNSLLQKAFKGELFQEQ